MSEYEFWQAVFVAAVRRGNGSTYSRTIANEAVADLRATFSGQAGQSATPKTELILSERDAR